MAGILARILGSGDVVGKGMDLIDDLWETDAEKRESKTSAKINLMKAYAPFRLAQRYLAIMFAAVYLSTYILTLVCSLAGVGDTAEITKVMTEFNMGWIMTAIIIFYFGGGLAESSGKAIKKGKS